MSVLCENCGQTLRSNTDICPNCGTPVPSSEPQDVLAAAFAQIDLQQSLTTPEPPEPEPPPGDPQPEEAPPPRKKGVHKGLLLLGVVLVLMAALVVVLTRVPPKGGGLSGIAYLDEDRVLCLLDGTLYFWNGKTSEKLEENVSVFWVPGGAKASAETYYCSYYY